ncbi:MAG: hypothetical protein QOI06_926 [Nocardioidaceae bacterium]|jgi:hypothetical protein|nr:hypothetical protein [Nocardioidaceae bacterium]
MLSICGRIVIRVGIEDPLVQIYQRSYRLVIQSIMRIGQEEAKEDRAEPFAPETFHEGADELAATAVSFVSEAVSRVEIQLPYVGGARWRFRNLWSDRTT